MDTTEYPSFIRLAGLHAQLAKQARDVEKFVDDQLDEVERLLRAVADRDWDTVLRLSEALILEPTAQADKAVVRSAKKVCDALRRDPSGARASARLAELLDACRTAKLRSRNL